MHARAGSERGGQRLPAWTLARGELRAGGRRIRPGCTFAPSPGAPIEILQLRALTSEGLILLEPSPGTRCRLSGALRFETRSASPPEGGFILHLGIDDQSREDRNRYVSLHVPVEKGFFELWRFTRGCFACELQRPYERPAIGEIVRFELVRNERLLSFRLGQQELLREFVIEELDGAVGLGPKFCETTLWLDGHASE